MKVNEIIVEGPTWDAVKSGITRAGQAVGKVAGSVAGAGRAAAAAYDQGVDAVAKGYQAAATSMGGGNQIPNTPGAKTALARYRKDWESFANDYQQGGDDLSDPANFKSVLDQFIRNKYGVDTSKYPAIQLASISSKSAANYIYAVNSRARADSMTNASNSSQLQTGYAAPVANTSVTDQGGHTYTYTAPTGGAADGVWSYKGTAITRPEDIQVLNRLHLSTRSAPTTTPAPTTPAPSPIIIP
jgi:hypothetical protein